MSASERPSTSSRSFGPKSEPSARKPLPPAHFAPSTTLASVFLLLTVFVVIAIFPAPGGYNREWLEGVVVTCVELLLLVGILFWAFQGRLLTKRPISQQVVLGVLISTGVAVPMTMIPWVYWPDLLIYEGESPLTLPEALGIGLFTGLLGYALWVLIFRYPQIVIQASLRALEAERARMIADQNERQARLAPHFLLNSLNAVSSLISEEPNEARRVLSALGDLLRKSLYAENGDRHTVQAELEWIQNYATIMQARYGDRLQFEYHVAPDAAHRSLPQFILQPLVENAVKHGALRQRPHATIHISITTEQDGTLVCRIDNPGTLEPARVQSPPLQEGGHGVAIVERRLSLLEKAGTLTLEPVNDRVVATVRMP